MQYVGKVGGYVYNQWNSLNPLTLSGAIDIIVVEQPDGTLHCSPWHVRFGKFQIIKPLQKKIDLYVNDVKTDLPMKLGDGGEGFFVFETDSRDGLSQSVLTSPVISPVSSASTSPIGSPQLSGIGEDDIGRAEPELLDLNANSVDIEDKIKLSDEPSPVLAGSSPKAATPTPSLQSKTFEKVRKITQKLNIPSKIDINGDIVLDMDGYKPNAQKNIDNSDELFKKIFLQEIKDSSAVHGSNTNSASNSHSNSSANVLGEGEEELSSLWEQFVSKDKNGNIRILNRDHLSPMEDDLMSVEGLVSENEDDAQSLRTSASVITSNTGSNTGDGSLPSSSSESSKTYFKTLRLTSEQMQKMKLHYGENKLTFKLSEGTAQIESYLYLWRATTPIVISDIDGTITKSDALGHVLNLFGKDWTHPGVATLFTDIKANGYNIIYLTARSVGQADTTRQYLRGIVQDNGVKLPQGPVILSPDRTMAALRREVILKKPEVFKMACLNDIKSLYFHSDQFAEPEDDERTPFYAGFGNRITDAISYRSVKIPSHRIFTINPNGEVHMELLELAGYKSSYLHIGELVDQFFPPIKQVSSLDSYWNDNQLHEYMSNLNHSDTNDVSCGAGSPRLPGSPRSLNEEGFRDFQTEEKFNDVNYWREPLSFSDLSDLDDEETATPEPPKSPGLLLLRSFTSDSENIYDEKKAATNPELNETRTRSRASSSPPERPTSVSSFTSPLKNFMMFGSKGNDIDDDDDYTEVKDNNSPRKSQLISKLANARDDSLLDDGVHDSDYTAEEDLDDDDDYTDDDYDEDEDDDYEDDDDYDEEEEEEDYDEEEDFDEEDIDDDDIDEDDGLPEEVQQKLSITENSNTKSKVTINNNSSIEKRKASCDPPQLGLDHASGFVKASNIR